MKHLESLRFLLRRNRVLLWVWMASSLLCGFILFLYQAPLEGAVLFAWIFLIAVIVWLGIDAHMHRHIKRMLSADAFDPADYPPEARPYLKRLTSLLEELRLEQTLHQQEKKDLQDYFSLWAHQVKLPLSAMALQMELPDPSRKELIQCQKRIGSSVDMAMAFIRLEGSDFRFEPVSLEECVRSVIRSEASVLIARHMQPLVESDGSSVPADAKWVRFVIGQLLSNTVKYAPEGSRIIFRIHEGTLSMEDQGPGIPPEDLPRVFEKGFTGTNGHASSAASSGLGLYLCRQICQRMKCSLTLENLPEGGLAARMAFPPFQSQLD